MILSSRSTRHSFDRPGMLGCDSDDGTYVDFSPHADEFVAHYESVRGQVRLSLLHEQLTAHIPAASRILDVGGGAGHLAALLATDGHQVVVVEPSAKMRRRADDVVAKHGPRVHVEDGDAASVRERDDAGSFDAVVCHAVAPYVDELGTLIDDIVVAVRPGGVLSVVVKNRDALAMRPALEGRWHDVPSAVDADGDAGGIGVRNRAHTLTEVCDALEQAGCDVVDWYGIRVVSDALPYEADADADAVLAAERVLTGRDPYRAVGRLLHVVGHRHGVPA